MNAASMLHNMSLPKQIVSLPLHSLFNRHVLEDEPRSSKPSSQVMFATEPVNIPFTDKLPFLGLVSELHSTARVQSNYSDTTKSSPSMEIQIMLCSIWTRAHAYAHTHTHTHARAHTHTHSHSLLLVRTMVYSK